VRTRHVKAPERGGDDLFERAMGGLSLLAPALRQLVGRLAPLTAIWLLLLLLGSLVTWLFPSMGDRGAYAAFTLGLSVGAAFFLPRWLAWRVARPLGFLRLARELYALGTSNGSNRRGFARMLWAAVESPKPPPHGWGEGPIDAWAVCAEALGADRAGDFAGADRLVRVLGDLPDGASFSREARTLGLEDLAWRAAERGEWTAVDLRTRIGRGRSRRLLRRLSLAWTQRGPGNVGRLGAVALWLAWLAAPRRLASLAWVQAAVAPPAGARSGGAAGSRSPTVVAAAPVAGTGAAAAPRENVPFGLQLTMLADGAAGREVDAAALVRLVLSWEAQLDDGAAARLRARALELDARSPAAAAEAVRQSVLEAALAAASAATGRLELPEQGALAAELRQRLRDRLFAALDPFLGRFDDAKVPPGVVPPPALAEWRRWLVFRDAVGHLEAVLGPEALETAWRNGVQTAAWNWPCQIYGQAQIDTGWLAVLMFDWVVEVAERVNDDEAVTVNLRNLERARQSAAEAEERG
jgi:hypothetical protein